MAFPNTVTEEISIKTIYQGVGRPKGNQQGMVSTPGLINPRPEAISKGSP